MRPAVEVVIPPCIYNVTAAEHDKIVAEYGDSGEDYEQAVIQSDSTWVVGLTPFDWDDNDLEGDW